MLELQSISKTFHPGTIHAKKALQNLSLSLNDGDFVTVIGGNGAGKSTLLNAIAGVWPVDEGSILIDGVDVTGLPEYKRAAFIGRVFQDPMLGTAPNMQIEENLALALRRGKKRTLRWGVTKQEREDYYERLHALGLGLEKRMTDKVCSSKSSSFGFWRDAIRSVNACRWPPERRPTLSVMRFSRPRPRAWSRS